MEAIVSVLLLSILLVIISTMIQTSRNVTANSMVDATQFQEELFNFASLAQDNPDPDSDIVEIVPGSISLVVPGILPVNFVVTYDIDIYLNRGTRIAFLPNP